MRCFTLSIVLALITLLILTSSAFAANAGKEKEPKKNFTQEELDARHKLIDSIMLAKVSNL